MRPPRHSPQRGARFDFASTASNTPVSQTGIEKTEDSTNPSEQRSWDSEDLLDQRRREHVISDEFPSDRTPPILPHPPLHVLQSVSADRFDYLMSLNDPSIQSSNPCGDRSNGFLTSSPPSRRSPSRECPSHHPFPLGIPAWGSISLRATAANAFRLSSIKHQPIRLSQSRVLYRSASGTPFRRFHERDSRRRLASVPKGRRRGPYGTPILWKPGTVDDWKAVIAICQTQRYDLQKIFEGLKTTQIQGTYLDADQGILHVNAWDLHRAKVSHLRTCSTDTQLLDGRTLRDWRTVEERSASLVVCDVEEELERQDGDYLSWIGTKVYGSEMLRPEVDCFIFHHGVIVIWDIDGTFGSGSGALDAVLRYFEKYAEVPNQSAWKSRLEMSYCRISDLSANVPVPESRVFQEHIYLDSGDVKEKLAVSLAIAQSTRLSAYEEVVDQTIQRFGDLPVRIARNEFSKYTKYRSDEAVLLRKWVAEVFSLMVDVNIIEDFLDVPEYFWDCDVYQSLWKKIHHYLDIEERIGILNVRVGCLQDVLRAVKHERAEAQEVHLTWIVIVLLILHASAVIVREFLEHQ